MQRFNLYMQYTLGFLQASSMFGFWKRCAEIGDTDFLHELPIAQKMITYRVCRVSQTRCKEEFQPCDASMAAFWHLPNVRQTGMSRMTTYFPDCQ
jgi:hypothetical protein